MIGDLLAARYGGLVACQPLVGDRALLPYGKCLLGLLSGQRIDTKFARR